jgi:hypothetical protein
MKYLVVFPSVALLVASTCCSSSSAFVAPTKSTSAILQYVYLKAAETNGDSPSRKAAITSWISWANASLDPICFLETPEGKVYVHSTILFSIFYVTDLYLPVLSIYSIYLSFNLSSTFSDCAHITLLFCYFYQK